MVTERQKELLLEKKVRIEKRIQLDIDELKQINKIIKGEGAK